MFSSLVLACMWFIGDVCHWHGGCPGLIVDFPCLEIS